jgi:hypothetical protein
MSLRSIIVPNVNHNVLAKRDIHDWPWTRMIFTAVEPYVEPLIRHYDGESGPIS